MPGSVTFADPKVVADLLAAGKATLIDVREPGEHAAERIKGARLVPLSAFDPAKARPEPGTQLVLHCAAGVRCGMAAQIMQASGYPDDILRLDGGIRGWRADGLPTER